ncbi:spore germination protein GerPC [Bacillus sp. V33-4]|uniref:spore germination protein GerPC n=1 Tax=Bacillus sp. V33-4 TaxID=2054169 RepID=UPI000C768F56|nr:spore germination protein GerPC [Bacillus sp. V33-4]PLR87370.1 spore gernimation protein [Bacillus sp. V33-4]
MNEEFYRYLQHLHNFVQAQDKKIRALAKSMAILENEMKDLKEKPSIRVERIEYKFDQLKVETLEGTLNIGLNPTDLQGIEDFSVNNDQMSTPFSPKERMQMVVDIEEHMNNYIDSDLKSIVDEAKNQLNLRLDDSYTSFIKDDIKKQLPARIEHFINQHIPAERSPEYFEKYREKIIVQLKEEINRGVYTFLNHLPDTVKGMKTE